MPPTRPSDFRRVRTRSRATKRLSDYQTRSDFRRQATFDYRLSTMKLSPGAGQSREKSQKIARKITENRPDFCPGCCAGAVAAVGLPSPAFLYPRRLALCGRLCAPLCGVSGCGSIGIAPPPGVALWGYKWCFRRCMFPGLWIACPCAPLWAALWSVSGLACTPVPLPGCVALCVLCGGCGRLSVRGCAVALSIVPAWRLWLCPA